MPTTAVENSKVFLCEQNHWIAGGEAGEEAFQQLLLIAAVHHFRLPMNQYTYEPVYHLVFQLLTGWEGACQQHMDQLCTNYYKNQAHLELCRLGGFSWLYGV